MGIPLSSVPRLYRLQSQLMELDPAQLQVAVQVDARLVPPAHAVPTLKIQIRPAKAGAFEEIDRSLPLSFESGAATPAGLKPPGTQRRWMVYGMPPASQAELRQIQERFRRLRAQGSSTGGGSLSLGLEQKGLAPNDPAWRDTRWETWLQTSKAEGYFEVWSGTVADLSKSGSGR